MPIYPRGNAWLVSVGSGENRFRQSYETRREAEAAELAAKSRMKATGTPLEGSKAKEFVAQQVHTLGEMFDILWKTRWKHDRSPETHDYHTRKLFRTIHPRTPVTEIDAEMIEEAVLEWDDQEISGATINRRLVHLNQMLQAAVERGWLDKAPKMKRRKENKHRTRWLSDEEEAKVLSKCAELGYHDLADFIVCAIDSGFRRSELLNLKPADFFNDRLHLHAGETKNGYARSVPATDRVRRILQHRKNKPAFFAELSVDLLRRQWKLLKKALGYEDDSQFIVHMLRHTCASRLVQDGVPLPVVQQWMGHRNITTTMRYAHLAPNALMQAVAVLNTRSGKPELKAVNV